MSEPLLIADVPWLLYRAFFSLPKSIVDGEGRPVNALLGTVNALLSALQARPARAVLACFGAEEAVYRVELYPPYHAHRDPMPEALAAQWELAPRLLESLGWYVPASEELEADDVMGSYAQLEATDGGHALILSGDRDMFQAVSERVRILQLDRDRGAQELGPGDVRERYGIDPELVPDFIALRGDPSDGIPGAPGIGEKTARELLRRHGSLEGALSGVDSLRGEETPRIVAALRENAEQLRAFKRIATLVPIEVELPADRPTDFAAGAAVARELGMRQLAERLEGFAKA